MSEPLSFEPFLQRHFVMALATSDGEQSSSTPLYYLYLEDHKWLVFTSDPSTLHMRLLRIHPEVSGCVFTETMEVEQIQGIQFRGTLVPAQDEALQDRLKSDYLQRFPMAKTVFETRPSPLWAIQLDWVKWSDNSQGFGYKEIWSR